MNVVQRDFWQTIILDIAKKRESLNRPIIQGILGPIGVGKSTLGNHIAKMLGELGLRAVSFSLDDLYKTYQERTLLRKKDSRLIWRGPPGTHDVSLGLQLFEQVLESSKNILLWRFDKSLCQGQGDRIKEPEISSNIDVLLFEGWFVGVRPINFFDLKFIPELINTPKDISFAKDCNQRLVEYLPLWEKIDHLIVLCPEDYRYSLQWRQEAEKKQQIGMTSREIEDFVFYFWRALHP